MRRKLLYRYGKWILLPLILLLAILLSSVWEGLSFTREGDFSTQNQSGDMHALAIEEMQRFRINGIESSKSLVEHHDEYLSIVGFANKTSFVEYHEFGYRQFQMIVPEKVEGVMVYHVLYFFETPDTIWEDRIASKMSGDFDDFTIDLGRRPRDDSSAHDHQMICLIFSVHDSWIRAERIFSYSDMYYKRSESSSAIFRDAFPDFRTMRRERQTAESEGQFWLDISEGETIELAGVGNGGVSAKMHVRIPAKLGSAVIYHFVRVRGLEQENVKASGAVVIPVTLSDGTLVYY